MRTGEVRRALHGGYAAAVTPDGTWVAAGLPRDPLNSARLGLWTVAGGQCRQLRRGHPRLTALAVTPDGRSLVTAGDDGIVRKWDPRAPKRPAAVLARESDPVISLAAAPDSRHIVYGTATGTISVRSTSGTAVAMIRIESAVHACVWSPDGGALFIGGDTGLYKFTFHS